MNPLSCVQIEPILYSHPPFDKIDIHSKKVHLCPLFVVIMSQSPEPREERERDEYMRSRSPEPNRERSESNTPLDSKQRRRSPPRPSHAPANPEPTTMVGVFGLSVRTNERDLEEEFGRIAPIDKVTIVYDARVSANQQNTVQSKRH